MAVTLRSTALAIGLCLALSALTAGPSPAQADPPPTYAFGWGDNSQGQLGNGQVADDSIPVAVGSGANTAGTWKHMAAAWVSSATCGISGDDSAYCWGYNSLGQVGDGTTTNRYGGPVRVSAGANASNSWKAVTVGGEFWTCGIGGDDRAYCWGYNDRWGNAATPGFLGNGTTKTTDDSVPRAVSNGANGSGTYKAISAGWPVTCGIGTDDRAYCWGPNNTGAIGNGTYGFSLDDSVPRLVSNGANAAGTWTAISVGNKFACGVATNARIYCWGEDWSGTTNTTPALLPGGANAAGTWTAVSAGKDRACGIGTNGKGYCWGYGPTGDGTGLYSGTPVQVSLPGNPTVTAISAGRWGSPGTFGSCAIAGGLVYCWGGNGKGQLGDGQQPTDSNSPVAVVMSGVLSGRDPLEISVGDKSVLLVTGPATATIAYDPNQATSGTPPPPGSSAIGSTYTVAANSGNLARMGYTFAGWNTLANGNGTTYPAGSGSFTLTGNTTLYAAWQAIPPPPPPPQPPGPPYLQEAKPSNQAVTLTWRRPDSTGTYPVNEYRVYAVPGGQVCTVRAATWATYSCKVSGLTNGKPYEFWVTAVSDAGESLPSNRLTATPRPDKPERPNFTALIGGNQQATAYWEPPATDGGAPITAYYVYSSTGGSVCKVAAAAGPPYSCTITGLKNYVSYQMWVTAVNEAGESPQSRWLSVIPAPVRPGPPRDIAGLAVEETIRFAWKPPLDEGSYPIEFYQLWLEPDGAACRVQVPETSCTVEGLKPGASYRGRVRAYSKAGYGPMSDFSTTITVPLPRPQGISVEVRRSRKDPDLVRVTGQVTRIKPGAALWVWIHRENDEYGYWESFQGDARPIVQADGTFTWERRAPINRIWEVNWCTGPSVTGICSPWTLLVDPTG